jgi:hypothetical protein
MYDFGVRRAVGQGSRLKLKMRWQQNGGIINRVCPPCAKPHHTHIHVFINIYTRRLYKSSSSSSGERGWDEKSRQQQECAARQSCPIIKYWLKITNRFFKLPFRARTGYIEVGILITLLSFFIEFSVNLNLRRKKDAQHMLPRRRAAAHFPVLV